MRFRCGCAPVQIGLVPISERHLAYAEKVEAELKAAGFRVETDVRNEKMNAKIRDLANQKIPYILVFGDKEEAAGDSERAHARQRRPGIDAAGGIHRQGKGAGGEQVDGVVASSDERHILPDPVTSGNVKRHSVAEWHSGFWYCFQ